MDKIISGVERFRSHVYPTDREFFEHLARKQQKPIALFITCADSRVHPNLITQTEPGELFLLRNAGNIVPPHGAGGGEAATIEYSVEVLGIRDIVVCGHSQCGAIKALLEGQGLEHMTAVRDWCRHAEATRRIVAQKYRGLTGTELATAAAKENVLVQMNHVATHPCVAARLASRELQIRGWYYDIGAGEVSEYDTGLGRFELINGGASSSDAAAALSTPDLLLA